MDHRLEMIGYSLKGHAISERRRIEVAPSAFEEGIEILLVGHAIGFVQQILG